MTERMSSSSLGKYILSGQQMMHVGDICTSLETAHLSMDVSAPLSGKTICMLHTARQLAERGTIRSLVIVCSEEHAAKLQKTLSDTMISRHLDVNVYTYEMMTSAQVFGAMHNKKRACTEDSPREKQRRKHTLPGTIITSSITDEHAKDEDKNDSVEMDVDFSSQNELPWHNVDFYSPEFIVMCTRSGRTVPSAYFKSLISGNRGVLVACMGIDCIYNVGTSTYTNISALASFASTETRSVYMHFMSSRSFLDNRGRTERYYLSLCKMFHMGDLRAVTRGIMDPPVHSENKEAPVAAKKLSGFAIRKRESTPAVSTIVHRLVLNESQAARNIIKDLAQTGMYAMLSHLPAGKDEAAMSVLWKGPMKKYRVFRTGPLTNPSNHQLMASLVYMRANMFVSPPSDSKMLAILSNPESAGNMPKVVFHISDGQSGLPHTSSSCASSLSSSSSFSSSCSTFSSSSSTFASASSFSPSFTLSERVREVRGIKSMILNDDKLDYNIRQSMELRPNNIIERFNSTLFSVIDRIESGRKPPAKKPEKTQIRSTLAMHTKCYVPDAETLSDISREFVEYRMMSGRRMEELIVRASSREYTQIDVQSGHVIDESTRQKVNSDIQRISRLGLLSKNQQSNSFCSFTDQNVMSDVRDAYARVIGNVKKVDERFRLYMEPLLDSMCKLEMQKSMVIVPQVCHAFSISENASFPFKLVISSVFSTTLKYIVDSIVRARARVEVYVCKRELTLKEIARNVRLFKETRRPALIVFLQDMIGEDVDLSDTLGDMPVVTIVFPSFNRTAMQHALNISSLNAAAKSNSMVYVPFFSHVETEIAVLKMAASRLYEDVSMDDFEMMLMSMHSATGVFHPSEFVSFVLMDDEDSARKKAHVKARMEINDGNIYRAMKEEMAEKGPAKNAVSKTDNASLQLEMKRLHRLHVKECREEGLGVHDVWPIAYLSLLYKELLRRVYQMAHPVLCDCERTLAEIHANSSDARRYAMDADEITFALSTWESAQLMHPEKFLAEFFPGTVSDYLKGSYSRRGSFSLLVATPLLFLTAGMETRDKMFIEMLLKHFEEVRPQLSAEFQDFSSIEDAIEEQHGFLFKGVLNTLMSNKLFIV